MEAQLCKSSSVSQCLEAVLRGMCGSAVDVVHSRTPTAPRVLLLGISHSDVPRFFKQASGVSRNYMNLERFVEAAY